MVQNIKETGKTIRQMVKGYFITLMVMSMMANGKMIRLMVKESTLMQMG